MEYKSFEIERHPSKIWYLHTKNEQGVVVDYQAIDYKKSVALKALEQAEKEYKQEEAREYLLKCLPEGSEITAVLKHVTDAYHSRYSFFVVHNNQMSLLDILIAAAGIQDRVMRKNTPNGIEVNSASGFVNTLSHALYGHGKAFKTVEVL